MIKRLERPPSLHQSVQEAIRSYVLTSGLKPGDLLPPETELAKRLGVSRNSVREAVKVLESTGVVEARRGAGLFVGDFSFGPLLHNLPYGLMQDLRQLSELLDIRLVLETGLIAEAVDTLTDEKLDALKDLLGEMRLRAERGESFPEEDRAFHRLLFSGLDNKMLLELLDVFWFAFRTASEQIDIKDPDPVKTYRDHALIVDAVEARDVEGARRALRDSHYAGIRKRLDEAQNRMEA